MKRFLYLTALIIMGLFALNACGPSADEQERRAEQREREKLHEERQELKEERHEQTQVQQDCIAAYNTCIARCDELYLAGERASCVSDCERIKNECLMNK